MSPGLQGTGSHDGEEPSRRDDILDAIRTIRDEPALRGTAQNPNLRAGRVEVFNVMAIDLSELLNDPVNGGRALQQLRASDKLFKRIQDGLVGHVADCASRAGDIRRRMNDARAKGGKAVWTDQFVDRYAPITLPCPKELVYDNVPVPPKQVIDSSSSAELHMVRFIGHELQMFRDGTITYRLRTEFVAPGEVGATGALPPLASEAIGRLLEIDKLAESSFRRVLVELLRPETTRATLAGCISLANQQSELIETPGLEAIDLRRRGTSHSVLFIECFYDGGTIESFYEGSGYTGENDASARVELQSVLTSSALPGILNTASWYSHYNSRYVKSLSRKEIGYRDDEIYLTDRKATIAVNPKFWDRDDPLSLYKHDIVLAIEYNLSRLAYFGAILRYYQSHPDVQLLHSVKPETALERVVEGQSILSFIEESLDLTLLIDHGFTRLFVRRFQEELGFSETISFIRARVEYSETVVGLRSAVLAAAENNSLQKTIRKIAVVGVVVAVVIALVQWFVIDGNNQPTNVRLDESYCLVEAPNGTAIAPCAEEDTDTTETPGG